jgi:hypothetical protein
MQNPNSSEDPANPGKAKQSAPPTKHRSQIKEEGTGSEKGIPSEHDAVEEQEINKYKDSIKSKCKMRLLYSATPGANCQIKNTPSASTAKPWASRTQGQNSSVQRPRNITWNTVGCQMTSLGYHQASCTFTYTLEATPAPTETGNGKM